MDKPKDTMSNKKNWLVEWADITENECDFFLKLVRDHDGKKKNQTSEPWIRGSFHLLPEKQVKPLHDEYEGK